MKSSYCLRCKRYAARVARGVDPIDAAREPPIGQTCEICGSLGRGRSAGLVLDHDHETGRFRGWLCDRCNRAISALDHEDVLRAAIAYLARAPAVRR